MAQNDDTTRLELILLLIGYIERRLTGWTLERFEGDQDEIDLTAYRLAVIGEEANKLDRSVQSEHPTIDWKQIYRMRNVVSHAYAMIDPSIVWKTATQDVFVLRDVCEQALERRR